MKKQIVLLALLVFTSFSYGQKLKVQKGNFSFLKGQKEINVEFVYDNMTLYKDNKSNEQYMIKRSKELEEKARGKGKAWEKKWISSRENIYAPKFLELINIYLKKKKKNVYYGENLSDAKYTLIVETVWVYPGYNIGIMKKGAKVSTKLTFVETENRDNTLLIITAKNAPGDTYMGSFSNEDRIGEAYAKTGKSLIGLLLKKAYKK